MDVFVFVLEDLGSKKYLWATLGLLLFSAPHRHASGAENFTQIFGLGSFFIFYYFTPPRGKSLTLLRLAMLNNYNTRW